MLKFHPVYVTYRGVASTSLVWGGRLEEAPVRSYFNLYLYIHAANYSCFYLWFTLTVGGCQNT